MGCRRPDCETKLAKGPHFSYLICRKLISTTEIKQDRVCFVAPTIFVVGVSGSQTKARAWDKTAFNC
jgi:hypothetical protein